MEFFVYLSGNQTLFLEIYTLPQTHTQVWVRFYGLSQDYWHQQHLMEIARGVGTPLQIDKATKDRQFGYFARVLVDVNLADDLPSSVMVERETHCFPIDIVYENMCTHCGRVGHMANNCRHLKVSSKEPNQKLPEKPARTVRQEYRRKVDVNKVSEQRLDTTTEVAQHDHVADGDLNEVPYQPPVISVNASPEPMLVAACGTGGNEVATDLIPGIEPLTLNVQVHEQQGQVSDHPTSHVASFVNNICEEAAIELIEGIADVVINEEVTVEDSGSDSSRSDSSRSKSSAQSWHDLVEEEGEQNVVTTDHPPGFGPQDSRPALEIDAVARLANGEDIDGFTPVLTKSQQKARAKEQKRLIKVEESQVHKNPLQCSIPTVIGSSPQQITIQFSIDGTLTQFSFVYAATTMRLRKTLWSELLNLRQSITVLWMVIGDFNAVLGAHESSGGGTPNRSSCEDFRSVTELCNFQHLDTSSAFFTWSRGLGPRRIERRLDRSLCDETWFNSWPYTSCIAFPQHWNLSIFGNVHKNLEDARSKLSDIQFAIASSGASESLIEEEVVAKAAVLEATHKQESFWKDRARVKWLTEGDKCTAFFHAYARNKSARTRINYLQDGETLLIDSQEIVDHVVNFYQSLYSADTTSSGLNDICAIIPNLVSHEESSMLVSTPTPEEIHDAVFSMDPSSSPGPDGFPGSFYQKCWSIIGQDVVAFVQYFFQNNWLHPNVNSNFIVLIPKVEDANQVSQFPIALANFLFKIIPKILATRLGPIASRIISPQQTAFLKGRRITENIGMVLEGFNLLDRKIAGGNVGIKVDIAKAFDTLNWQFLIEVLHRSVWFWGVRQGDPLSPILFCIAEEALSRGLTALFSSKKVRSISLPRGCSLTHVLYADDLFIFCTGDAYSLRHLQSFLDNYGVASGQLVNKDKSTFYLGASHFHHRHQVKKILGFKLGTSPFSYLGVPIFKGKPRRKHLQALADKAKARLSGWQGKLLSMAGRVQLVHDVFQSICFSIVSPFIYGLLLF
ncbi:hypothetical protein ACLB2K_017338 [Fragaria x ananassa]